MGVNYHITLFLTILMIISLCIATTGAQTLNLCTNEVGPRCSCSYDTVGRLYIRCNDLSFTDVPVGIQQDAYYVDFSRNAITRIESDDFRGLGKLNALHLENNDIEFIAHGAFSKLYKLELLNLNRNKLKEIKADFFDYLPTLRYLLFSNNLITTIQRDLLMRLPSLDQLNIGDNPLICDCEMRAFKQSLDARRYLSFEVDPGICVGTNIYLTDMTDSQFGSCTDDLFNDISCVDCKNARSSQECIIQLRQTSCSVSQHTRPVCYEEVDLQNRTISKGCQSYSQCLQMERNNSNQCYNGSDSYSCWFCCVGSYCNKGAPRGRIHTASYFASIIYDYFEPNSSEVQFLEVINGQLNNQNEFHGSFYIYALNVSVPRSDIQSVDLNIILTTREEYPTNNREEYITESISSIENLRIKSFDVVLSDLSCSSEVTENEKGVFEWLFTHEGTLATVACPENSAFFALRGCFLVNISYAIWSPANYSSCPISSSVTQSLEELSHTTVTNANVAQVQTDLLTLTKKSPEFTETDIMFSIDVIEHVLNEQSVFSNQQIGQEMVESLSNILNSPDDALLRNNNKSSDRFVNSVELLANNIVASSGFSAVYDNLALLVRQADPSSFKGITVNAVVQQGEELTENKIVIKDGEDISVLDSGVVVPASFFDTTDSTSPKFSFAIYGNNKIFAGVDASDLQTSKADQPNQINGPVISTTLQKTDVNHLKQPVLFRFKHFNTNSDRPQCVFINKSATFDLEWSTEGCNIRSHVPGSHTDCECTHLTNFALLMDIYQTGGRLSKANRLALTYISYIGCGVSLLGLLLTLVTYFMFRKLRTNNPSKLLINLCIALAMTNIIFLIGMQEYTLDNDIGCKIVAASLHYAILAALCWMLVEAFYMYRALIHVFNTYFSNFMLKCCLFGWGVPLVIVGVTLGINSTNNYGQQNGGICWLSPIPFYAAFLAPVGIVLILNFITYIRVFRIIVRGSGMKTAKRDDKTNVSQRLKGAISVIVLLGLTWVLAIFAIDDGGIIFQYLFTIFNSLQGLFIFIFYCFLKSDARNAWKRKFSRAPQKYSDPSSGSKERNSDTRSRDTDSGAYSFQSMDQRTDFTDISKGKGTTYPEIRANTKSGRYPSYSDTTT